MCARSAVERVVVCVCSVYMANDKNEQQMLLKAALKELGRRLGRDLRPEEAMPDRMRELLAQLDGSAPHKKPE